MICPKCRAAQAHRSHRRGLIEDVAALFAVCPYRCHGCAHRFLARETRADRGAVQRKRKRRDLLLYGTCFLLLLAFLYYVISRNSVPYPEDDDSDQIQKTLPDAQPVPCRWLQKSYQFGEHAETV